MFRKIKRKWIFHEARQAGSSGERGQSLVEMAIIAPLLLLMFIGVLEVGWAIRGYVVLLNADREATRFAARGQYLDFRQSEIGDIGYGYVVSHTLTSMSQQLPFDVASDEPNGTLIVSHYLVKTGKPCADPPCNDDCAADHNNHNGGCDCSTPDRREPDYPYDDAVLHPGMEGYQHFTALYGISRASRLNHNAVVTELKEQNDVFNCSLNLKEPAAPWATNSVVAVEAFYDQPQLLGVPIVSNYLTDPIPLYAHTIMRIAADRGAQGGGEEAGCALLPITVHIDNVKPPPDRELLAEGTVMNNIREGAGSGNFGWLRWTDDTDAISGNPNSEGYLAEELANPLLAMNDYEEPQHKDDGYPPDHDTAINSGDWVWGLTGNVNSNGVAKSELLRIQSQAQVHRIPVWSEAEGTGSNTVYQIVGFIKVILTGHDLTGNPKEISAVFMGWDDTCGTSSGGGGGPAPGSGNDDDGDGISNTVEDFDGDGDPANDDADGDGTPNYQDTDSDNDTLQDSSEGAGDADGDGLPNYLDTDSDGDSIPDSTEGAGDPDGDGIPNFLDADADGDAVADSVEGTADSDGDGTSNYLDTDSDNDVISDGIEGTGDADGDGTPNYLDTDSDGDGTLDSVEGTGDVDGDGTPNYLDPDTPGGSGPVAADDFESGGPSGGSGWSTNWNLSGDSTVTTNGGAHAGSYHLRMQRDTGLATRTVDMSGVSGARLQFWWKADSFEGSENAKVAVYDGAWHTVLTVNDGQDDDVYHYADIDLSSRNMVSDFTVAIDAEMSQTSDRFYVDDIEIIGN